MRGHQFLRPLALLAAGVLAMALGGCATQSDWLQDTVNLPFYRHVSPDSPEVIAAERDPQHLKRIETAAKQQYKVENPDLPHYQLEHLVRSLDNRKPDEEYVRLARRLAAADPDHYNNLLVILLAERGIDACESELVTIAFENLPADAAKPRRNARTSAAQALVRKLAFDAPRLPRDKPVGAPSRLWTDEADARCRAHQWAAVAAYSTHPATVTHALGRADHWLAADSFEDHEKADIETVVWRIRELDGKRSGPARRTRNGRG